ncbi:MAG: hypothetical protein OES57_00630 [Acidimicrobiia bacterium]|nr:hypothetical protein [Acidimicrobiia bacterium]
MSPHAIAVLRQGVTPEQVGRWVTALAGAVEIDRGIDPVGDLDPRRRWASPAGAGAVVQIQGHQTEALRSAIPAHARLGILLVERRELWRDGAAAPTPGDQGGLTQISFVAARPGADFARRYARHIDIVRTEHPGVAHYRQDVVVDRVDTDTMLDDTAAVSQLWFATESDFADRYYASDASPAIVRTDVEAFLDYEGTWSVLTRAHHR